jgi:hypothetical protein
VASFNRNFVEIHLHPVVAPSNVGFDGTECFLNWIQIRRVWWYKFYPHSSVSAYGFESFIMVDACIIQNNNRSRAREFATELQLRRWFVNDPHAEFLDVITHQILLNKSVEEL